MAGCMSSSYTDLDYTSRGRLFCKTFNLISQALSLPLSSSSSFLSSRLFGQVSQLHKGCSLSSTIFCFAFVIVGPLETSVRKSDVTTFRGAFESVLRSHYPSLVGSIVIKCVPCPAVCTEALAVLSSLSPYR